MLRRSFSAASQDARDSPTAAVQTHVSSGSVIGKRVPQSGLTLGPMQRMATPGGESENRTESARKVLEARRQKQKTDEKATTPSMPEAVPPSPNAQLGQALGGRLLQGIHDILMLMDEKVETLVADVNTLRTDLQGLHFMDSSERRMEELSRKLDRGFTSLVSQMRVSQQVLLSTGEKSSEDFNFSPLEMMPKSRVVDLIKPRLSQSEVDKQRTSAQNSDPDLHFGMEDLHDTEDMISCGGVPEDDTRESRAQSLQSPGRHFDGSSGEVPAGGMDSLRSSTAVSKLRSSSRRTSQESRASGNGNMSQRASRVSARRSDSGVRDSENGAARTVKFLKDLQKSKTMNASSTDDRLNFMVRPRQRSSMQRFIWNFLEDPDLIRGGRSYGNCLSLLILISAILPVVPLFQVFDFLLLQSIGICLVVIDGIFFLEVLARFYGSPNRLRFFSSLLNWLDILSVILPIGLKVKLQSLSLAADAHVDIVGFELGLIVLVPVLRLLKLLRRFENSHLIKQAFREAIGALPSLLYCMMVLVLGFSAIIYVVEPRNNVETMPRAIWFTMVTLTTVGYGDVVPVSPGGNVVVCILMVVSAIYMAMPLGIVGKAFGSVWDDRHRLLLMERLRTRFSTVGYNPEDIPGLFCSYDENGDGELSMDEFRQMLQQLEVEAKDERAHDVFAAFDNDGSGAIDDMEFIKTLFPQAFKHMYDERKENEEEGSPATQL